MIHLGADIDLANTSQFQFTVNNCEGQFWDFVKQLLKVNTPFHITSLSTVLFGHRKLLTFLVENKLSSTAYVPRSNTNGLATKDRNTTFWQILFNLRIVFVVIVPGSRILQNLSLVTTHVTISIFYKTLMLSREKPSVKSLIYSKCSQGITNLLKYRFKTHPEIL